MNMKLMVSLVAMFGVSLAQADNVGGMSAKLSTLGVGAEYHYPINNNWGVSAGLYGYKYSRNETKSDIKYDADLKLRHFAVLGHYYPWQNGFHLSGGIVLNGTKLSATGNSNSNRSFDIGDGTYTAAQIGSVNAEADFRKIAPYFGVGYETGGDRMKEGLSFTADLGVMFTGSPRVDITPNCNQGFEALCNNASFKANVEKERASLRNDIDGFKAYPVLSIGLQYRF